MFCVNTPPNEFAKSVFFQQKKVNIHNREVIKPKNACFGVKSYNNRFILQIYVTLVS